MWAAPHRPTPHTRAERDLVERHAVAAHGGLGLGGADDVVPGVLVEVGARLADELVQVLEGFAAGAEFGVARCWPDCFVHLVSPGNVAGLFIIISPILSRGFTPSQICMACARGPLGVPDFQLFALRRGRYRRRQPTQAFGGNAS